MLTAPESSCGAATCIQIESYGVPVRIECDASISPERLRSVLPPHSAEVGLTDFAPTFSLTSFTYRGTLKYRISGPERRITSQDTEEALSELRKEVHLHIGKHAPHHVFVHAGVACFGRLLVICPGRSYSGKSTLIKSMLDAGATYFSDEYAVFDVDGCIHSFPFPMSLRFPAPACVQVRRETIGTGPARPDVLLFAKFHPDRIWNPRDLAPCDAALQLARHSIAMRSRPDIVLPVLARVAKMTRAYIGFRGDTTSVLHWLGTIDR